MGYDTKKLGNDEESHAVDELTLVAACGKEPRNEDETWTDAGHGEPTCERCAGLMRLADCELALMERGEVW